MNYPKIIKVPAKYYWASKISMDDAVPYWEGEGN
jgi:hypothetical protein